MATTNATAPQGATAPKSAPKASQSKGFTGIKSGFAVILCCFVIAICIFLFVFGAVSHFQGGVETGKSFMFQVDGELQPITGDLIGTVYKGGFIVPLIWTMLLSVLAFAIERFFAIRNAYGRTSLAKFVADIKVALQQKDLVKAQALLLTLLVQRLQSIRKWTLTLSWTRIRKFSLFRKLSMRLQLSKCQCCRKTSPSLVLS